MICIACNASRPALLSHSQRYNTHPLREMCHLSSTRGASFPLLSLPNFNPSHPSPMPSSVHPPPRRHSTTTTSSFHHHVSPNTANSTHNVSGASHLELATSLLHRRPDSSPGGYPAPNSRPGHRRRHSFSGRHHLHASRALHQTTTASTGLHHPLPHQPRHPAWRRRNSRAPHPPALGHPTLPAHPGNPARYLGRWKARYSVEAAHRATRRARSFRRRV